MSSIFDIVSSRKETPSPQWARRISTFVSDLTNRADKNEPNTNDSSIDSSTQIGTASVAGVAMADAWKIHYERKNVYQDIERMDADSELVSTAFDIYADFTVGTEEDGETSFRVIAANEKTQKVLDDLNRRLDLQHNIWQICRGMYKHGNEFREVIIDRKKKEIVGLKQTVSYQIYPNMSDKGDKLPGWKCITDKNAIDNTVQLLEDWQICPFQFGVNRGYLVMPFLASARRNWNRLNKIEDAMAVARLIRAYDKHVHRVPIKNEWSKDEIIAALQRYKNSITTKRLMDSEGNLSQSPNPLDVGTDYYIPDRGDNSGGVTVLASTNQQLGNLNDVYYHREHLLVRLAVPTGYMQITSTQKTHLKAGSNMGDAEIMFAKRIRRGQACLRRGMQYVYDMQLMLAGILPVPGLYTIEFPLVKTADDGAIASARLDNAQAALAFVEAFGALPLEIVAAQFFKLPEDQKQVLDTFFKENEKTINDARIQKLKTDANPKPATPVKKLAQSNVPTISELTDIFFSLQSGINEDLREQGIPVPEADQTLKNTIFAQLASYLQPE
jgi:hypothetical protein